MRNVLILFFCIGFFNVYSQNFTIEGKILTPFDKYIYLRHGNSTDSVKVKDQKFRFSGKIDYTQKANLFVNKDAVNTGNFMLDPSNCSIEIFLENEKNVYVKSLTGSATTEKLKSFFVLKNKSIDLPNVGSILYGEVKKLIMSEPENQVNAMLIKELLSEKYISLDKAKELLSVTEVRTQNNDDMVKISTMLNTLEKTKIGAKFPDIKLPSKNGREQSLYNSKGRKYTLVYFSSTSCITCLELDRKMVEVYNELKKGGCGVYEIFLDYDKEMWLNNIYKQKIPWTCVLGYGGVSNHVAKELGIIEMPSNFLLDENNVIIDTNVGPTKLKKMLLKNR